MLAEWPEGCSAVGLDATEYACCRLLLNQLRTRSAGSPTLSARDSITPRDGYLVGCTGARRGEGQGLYRLAPPRRLLRQTHALVVNSFMRISTAAGEKEARLRLARICSASLPMLAIMASLRRRDMSRRAFMPVVYKLVPPCSAPPPPPPAPCPPPAPSPPPAALSASAPASLFSASEPRLRLRERLVPSPLRPLLPASSSPPSGSSECFDPGPAPAAPPGEDEEAAAAAAMADLRRWVTLIPTAAMATGSVARISVRVRRLWNQVTTRRVGSPSSAASWMYLKRSSTVVRANKGDGGDERQCTCMSLHVLCSCEVGVGVEHLYEARARIGWEGAPTRATQRLGAAALCEPGLHSACWSVHTPGEVFHHLGWRAGAAQVRRA